MTVKDMFAIGVPLLLAGIMFGGLQVQVANLSEKIDFIRGEKVREITGDLDDITKALQTHMYEWISWKATVEANAPDYARELRIRTREALATAPARVAVPAISAAPPEAAE